MYYGRMHVADGTHGANKEYKTKQKHRVYVWIFDEIPKPSQNSMAYVGEGKMYFSKIE